MILRDDPLYTFSLAEIAPAVRSTGIKFSLGEGCNLQVMGCLVDAVVVICIHDIGMTPGWPTCTTRRAWDTCPGVFTVSTGIGVQLPDAWPLWRHCLWPKRAVAGCNINDVRPTAWPRLKYFIDQVPPYQILSGVADAWRPLVALSGRGAWFWTILSLVF